MQKIFYLIFTFLFLFSPELFSIEPQKDTIKVYDLSEIVVTANKNATPISQVASSVTVLTKEFIESSNKITVAELLRGVEGVEVSQGGGLGQLSRVFLRGANPHHTLILVDGVEVNDASSISNAFDLANLQSNNIERIEILRGPQSTLYGSDALAGVISIFTKSATEANKINVTAEAGSYQTYKTAAGFNGTFGKLNLNFDYSRIHSNGFSTANEIYGNTENDSYLNNSFHTKLNFQASQNLKFGFLANLSKSNVDLDQNERSGDDPNFISKSEDLHFKFSTELNSFENIWNQTLNISYVTHKANIDDEVDELRPNVFSNAYFKGSRAKIEWQNNLNIFENNSIIIGAEIDEEKARSEYFGGSDWGAYESILPESKTLTSAAFLQDQFNFGSFFGTAGIRIDDHQKFGSEITYRIAPAYLISAINTKLKATYGTGFKSPSLYYLFDPMYGNPELQPEKSKGFDAGIEHYISKFAVLGVTYFQNEYSNLIGYNSNFQTVNIDKAKTEGIESFVQLNLLANLAIGLNYTFTNAKDESETSADFGEQLLRRPKNKIALNLNYAYKNLTSNFEIINNGKRFDKDFAELPAKRVELKSYTLMNFAASYSLTGNIKFFGRVENILNEDYEEILFYGNAKRSFYAGLKLNLM